MTKAIFVDGASLARMRPGLGINLFEFKALYQILTEEVGTEKEIFGKPFYTISKAASEGTWVKTIRSRGFEVAIIETENGQDDKLIIDRIKTLKPGDVSEIVLVSADQDFVPVLRDKKAEGIKIYWVATKSPTEEGRRMIGEVLEELLGTEFEFVELANFKDRLMRSPWVGRVAQPEPPKPQRKVKVTLEIATTHDESFTILDDVMKIVKQHPEMKYTIES